MAHLNEKFEEYIGVEGRERERFQKKKIPDDFTKPDGSIRQKVKSEFLSLK